MGKQISAIKKIIALITLRYFNVSPQRKTILRFTVFILAVALLLQVYKSLFLPPIPLLSPALSFIILTLLMNLLLNSVRLFLVSSHRTRRGIRKDERDNFTVAMNALVNTGTFVFAILFFFLVFNIDVRAFLSSIAIFAVALTLIFQDYIKNFLFGLSMMFSNDYEIGDFVQIGTMEKGVITTITFTNLQLKIESGNALYVPNSVVRTQEVINFSKLKSKRMDIQFSMLREQVTEIAKLERDILDFIETQLTEQMSYSHAYLNVQNSNKDELFFVLEIESKDSSLKLKEKLTRAVNRFAAEYT